MDIFRGSNRLFDSVSDAESHDIEILIGFPGNLILQILMKNLYCVGGTNMRRCFLMKVCLIAIHNLTVILKFIWGHMGHDQVKKWSFKKL